MIHRSIPTLLLAFATAILVGCGGGSSGSGGSKDLNETAETGTDPRTETGTGDPVVPGAYRIVDTGQTDCYDDSAAIGFPAEGAAFDGQDAQHDGNQPSYTQNGDGTVSDNVTGLMWQQGFSPVKLTWGQAVAYADELNAEYFAGYDDWRLPSIKELYSLIDFDGMDPPPEGTDTAGLQPFIDDTVFEFEYGDLDAGERIIDSQWATTTVYVADPSMMFGVNFADGRIKGYGLSGPFPGSGEKTFMVRLCRGNPDYGTNSFVDNGDETVTDTATGLMWGKHDSAVGMTWETALAFVEARNAEAHLGYSDWRMPDVKELQSIVDYSRSPDTTASAAIDPVFDVTVVTNIAGNTDYPFFWTSTSHISSNGSAGNACYVAFGRALGEMNGQLVDIHGAGCQRSDPKNGDADDFPRTGYGPQGDVQHLFNFVRLVRDAK